MKAKGIATILLLAFVVVSVVALVAKETRGSRSGEHNAAGRTGEAAATTRPAAASPPPTAADPASDPVPARKETVVVYYFHGAMRCPTCLKIQALTQTTLQDNFASLLEDHSVLWKVVDVDEPADEHFVQDYQLTAQSVVLSRLRDGKEIQWKQLDRIWELISHEWEFRKYIAKEVEDFIANDKAAGS